MLDLRWKSFEEVIVFDVMCSVLLNESSLIELVANSSVGYVADCMTVSKFTVSERILPIEMNWTPMASSILTVTPSFYITSCIYSLTYACFTIWFLLWALSSAWSRTAWVSSRWFMMKTRFGTFLSRIPSWVSAFTLSRTNVVISQSMKMVTYMLKIWDVMLKVLYARWYLRFISLLCCFSSAKDLSRLSFAYCTYRSRRRLVTMHRVIRMNRLIECHTGSLSFTVPNSLSFIVFLIWNTEPTRTEPTRMSWAYR